MSEARLAPTSSDDTGTVERFYQRLLSIDCVADPALVLDVILPLLAEITGAGLVFLELFGEGSAPALCRGHTTTAEPIGSIRSKLSYGIVRQAVAEGRTITTSSAVHDERFLELSSVRQHEIGAVLCTPLGMHMPLGVIYLQRPVAFSECDRRRVEAFALRIARVAPRLLQPRGILRRPLLEDVRELQGRRVREAMERHDGNIAEVARELCVSRKFVYRALRRLDESVSE
jgi:Nif-specific regulatory protein